MSFGNKDVLIARFSDQATLFANMDEGKIEELGSQVSDTIYQITGIAIPTEPEQAPAMLRGIWCDIVLFKLVPYQKNIADEEKTRRSSMNKSAMALLWNISKGEIVVKNENGDTSISGTVPLQINGTKRIGGAIV